MVNVPGGWEYGETLPRGSLTDRNDRFSFRLILYTSTNKKAIERLR